MTTNYPVDFLIVTPLDEEFDAMCGKLPGIKLLPSTDENQIACYQADLPVASPDNTTGIYRIIVSRIGKGRVQAAKAITKAIQRWRPRCIILVGIAGGVPGKNIQIGDILIADQVTDYGLRKQTPEGPQYDWNTFRPGKAFLEACEEVRSTSWLRHITVERPDQGKPKLHIGPIASGDDVVASSEALIELTKHWPKLLGVEMEAGAVAAAAYDSNIPFGMVRAVSDHADEKKNTSEVDQWRAYACDTAAAFTIALLQSERISISETAYTFEKVDSRLEHYLPTSLLKEYRSKQRDPITIARVTDHLTCLLENAHTYRATPILDSMKAPAGHHHGQWIDATVLFAEVSGFAAMCERLSASGRAGVEEVAAVISRYYQRIVAVLHQRGGFIVNFSGDSFLAMFKGLAEDSAQNAVQAGLEIQRELAFLCNSPPLTGRSRLRANIGIHAGRVYAAHVGDLEQMEYWVVGEAMNLAAAVINAAKEDPALEKRGQVIITQAIARQLPPQTKFATLASKPPPLNTTFFAVPMTLEFRTSSSRSLYTSPQSPQDIRLLVEQLDLVTPYLPPGVLSQLIRFPVEYHFQGEHRWVTVLFIHVEGLDQLAELLGEARSDLLLETVQDCFTTIRTIVSIYRGIIYNTDLHPSGCRIVALFGVPKAHQGDANRAAKAALEIQAAFAELSQRLAQRCPQDLAVRLQQRIGLTTGDVFLSNINTETRQQSTIVGNTVNLAASLMAAAPWNEIWVSQEAHLWLQTYGDFEFTGEHILIGPARLPAYRLLRIHESLHLEPKFVNRDDELQTLQQQLQAIDAADFQGRIAILHGERGIGKSHLWQQASVWAAGQKYQCLQGRCSERGALYQVFAEILRQYLGLEDTDDPLIQRERLVQRVSSLFGPSEVSRRTPHLCIIMGLPPDEAWVTGITPPEDLQIGHPENYQLERIATNLVAFLRKIMEETPLLLICEDLHWINPDAAVILEYLLGEIVDAPRLMLGLSSIPGSNPQYDELERRAVDKYDSLTKSVPLKSLSFEHCCQIVADILGDRVPEEKRSLICQISCGNPLFIVESSRNLLVNPEAEIPLTIKEVIESRIDALAEGARSVLDVATVIGDTFSLEEIESTLDGTMDKRAVREGLLALHNAYFIKREGTNFSFVHQSSREIAHLRQNTELQRKYHQRLGEYWQHKGHHSKAADHYFAAELWDDALEWAKRAGEDCYTSYANAEGIRLYQQALTAAMKLQDTEAQVQLCQRLGDLHYRTGKYAKAVEYYTQQLQGLQDIQAPDIMQAAVYCALGAVYERWGQYDQALDALETGLSLADTTSTTVRARLLRVRCSIRCALEELDAAERDGQLAVAIAVEVSPPQELAYAHNNLAKVYAQQELENEQEQREQYELALAHHEEALKIRRGLGAAYDYEVAQSLENVGTQLCRLEQLDEAPRYYQEALEIQQRIGDPFGEGSVLHNWAWLHWDLKELDAAEEKFLRALALWTSIEYRKGQAYAQQDLGSLYKQQEQWEKALLYLEKATVLYKSLEIYNHLSETYLEQARVLKQLGQPAGAREAAQQALEFAKKTRNEKKAHKLAQAAQTWLSQAQDG